MADVVDAATRSRIMSRIPSKNTKIEILVRKALFASGLRFRLHRKDLRGKPDIVLLKHKAVVFVHGCYWHGHNCSLFRMPDTNSDFWTQKINTTRQKDNASIKDLLHYGWRVAVIWECALSPQTTRSDNLDRLCVWVVGQDQFLELHG